MIPYPADERRLDALLVRYFDHRLDDAGLDELEARLAADSRGDDLVEAYCLHALTAVRPRPAADWPALRPVSPRVTRPWRPLGLATGIAATVAVCYLALSRTSPPRLPSDRGPILARSSGTVRVWGAASGRLAQAGGVVEFGQTVSTVGLDASAMLAFADGSTVVLAGDTVATVGDLGRNRKLVIQRGTVSAEVPSREPGSPFTVATAEANAVADGGAKLCLNRTCEQTEVSVAEGRVHVTAPEGDTLADMTGGEMATVDPQGATRKQATSLAPDDYTWDLTRPLPPGWELGRIAADPLAQPFRRAVVPVLWDDPYIRRTCWQIRTDNKWATGLFRIHPDSRFRVRYRVDRAGQGQLLAVVRPDPLDPKRCRVLLAPLAFAPDPNGGWRTAELTAADWVPETKAPDYPQPWATILVVFNTYERDLGLRVAEFTVSRPRLAAPKND